MAEEMLSPSEDLAMAERLKKLKALVVEFVKRIASPYLKSSKIDKEQFKDIARRATDKVVDGQLRADPKCMAVKDKEHFMSEARQKKMKSVVEK